MPIWLALAIGFLVFGGAFVLCGFILLWPSKFRDLGDRLGGWDRISIRNPEWKPGLDIEWRGSAAIGMVLSGFALIMMVHGVLCHPHPSFQHVVTPPAPHQGPDWYSLGIGTVMTLLGVYIFVWPKTIIRWATWTMRHRRFGNEVFQKPTWPIRIAAIVLILAAVQALVAGFRYH